MGTDNSLAEKTVTSWICTSNTTADMNAKYALALILALQVSMSLCEVPPPSQELVDKYNTMKDGFYKRLLNTYGRVQAAVAPLAERFAQDELGQVAKDYIAFLQTKPQFQADVKVAAAIAQEAGPLADKARETVLGLYEHYLRDQIGTQLS